MSQSETDVLHLPRTPAASQVLVAPAAEERHGYALKAVARQTGGTLRLSTGTLYGIIRRLLDEDLIGKRTTRSGRRLYRLTTLGRAVARAEADRLETLLATTRATRALRRRPRADRGGSMRRTLERGARWYRQLLWFFPFDFRRDCGFELTEVFDFRGTIGYPGGHSLRRRLRRRLDGVG